MISIINRKTYNANFHLSDPLLNFRQRTKKSCKRHRLEVCANYPGRKSAVHTLSRQICKRNTGFFSAEMEMLSKADSRTQGKHFSVQLSN